MDQLTPSALVFSVGLPPLALAVLFGLALLFSSYIKIATALGMIRFGLGVSSLPSAFITGSLALSLTVLVMQPTYFRSAEAIDSMLRTSAGESADGRISDARKAKAIEAGIGEWKSFVYEQSHPSERQRFSEIAIKLDARSAGARAQLGRPDAAGVNRTELDESWRILAPAFVVSELKEAFATGLSLLLPFLVIDLLIANLLVAVGYDRLSPTTVAFPVKVLLFVLVDGWSLIAGNLVATYGS